MNEADDSQAPSARGGLPGREFSKLFVSSLVFSGSHAILLGALPLYLESRTPDTIVLGSLVGAFAFGSAAFQTVGAPWVDHVDLRRSLWLAAGLLLFASGLYVSVPSLWALATARVVHGVAFGLFLAAAYGWLARVTTEKTRGHVFGLFGLSQALTLVAMPGFGLVLLQSSGIQSVFLCCLVGSLLPFFLTIGGRPVGGERVSFGVPWSIVPLVVGLMLGASTVGTFEAFLPQIARDRSVTQLPMLFVGFGLAMAVGRFAGGGLSDRLGRPAVALAALVLVVSSLWAIPWVHGLVPMLCLASGFGLGLGAVFTAVLAWISEVSDPTRHGRILGLSALSIDVGIALGAVVAGVVAGHSTLWIPRTAAMLAAVSLVTLLMVARRKRRGALEPA